MRILIVIKLSKIVRTQPSLTPLNIFVNMVKNNSGRCIQISNIHFKTSYFYERQIKFSNRAAIGKNNLRRLRPEQKRRSQFQN